MKTAAAIVTNRGARRAMRRSLPARLGVPAVVGANDATEKLRMGGLSPSPAPKRFRPGV